MSGASAESGAARPRAAWRDPVLIGAALLWLALLLGLRGVHRAATLPELSCIALDQVALPGEEVEISALCELRHPSGRVDRAGIAIDLRRRDEAPGSGHVLTDAEGIARRSIVSPELPGSTVILAAGTLPHSRSPRPSPAGLLVVLDPARPLVIADTEGVPLGGAGAGDLAEDAVESLPAIAARQVLAALAAREGVVLLHAGEPAAAAAIRERSPWRLPYHVPVIAGRATGEEAAAYRARQIAEWRRRFGGSIAGSTPPGDAAAGILGIAASPSACAAFVGAGLDTVAIGEGACAGAKGVADWHRLPAALIEARERGRP